MQHICDGAFHGLLMSPSHSLARKKVRHCSRSSQTVPTFCLSDVSHLPPLLLPCVHPEIPVYREEPTQAGNSGVEAAVQIFSGTTRSLKSVTGRQELPALIWGGGGNICQKTASQKPVEPWYLVEICMTKGRTSIFHLETGSFLWSVIQNFCQKITSPQMDCKLVVGLLKLNHPQVDWTQICSHQSSPCNFLHLCKFFDLFHCPDFQLEERERRNWEMCAANQPHPLQGWKSLTRVYPRSGRGFWVQYACHHFSDCILLT